MCSKLKGKAGSMFSEGAKGLATDNIHECLVLPKILHRIASEIAFREETTIKKLVVSAAENEAKRLEPYSVPNNEKKVEALTIAFGTSEKVIHTSVFLPAEMIKTIRTIAHYSGIPKNMILANGLAELIVKEYGQKYPDVVKDLMEYQNSI